MSRDPENNCPEYRIRNMYIFLTKLTSILVYNLDLCPVSNLIFLLKKNRSIHDQYFKKIAGYPANITGYPVQP